MTIHKAMPILRSRLFGTLAALVLVAPLVFAVGQPAAAQDNSDDTPPTTYWDAMLNVEAPGSLGQSDLQVWVPQSQHTVRGYMLDYWRAQGASAVYGNPISEPFGATNGYYSQAFESAVFQFRPEFL